jgi:TRAP-type C4-dicarboxylate transport system, small permease component
VKIFNTVITKITSSLDYIAGLLLAALMAMIAINVVGRIFNMPIPGVSEWIPFLLATSVGLSIAYCALQNGHIAMGFLVDKLPKVPKLVVEVIIQLIIIVFISMATYTLWQYGFSTKANFTVGMVTRVPIYPFVFIIAFGFSMYVLAAVNGLFQLFAKKEDNK